MYGRFVNPWSKTSIFAMTAGDATTIRSLDAIRTELDSIDDRIHALIVERAALANEVRKAKDDRGVAALRPAREAAMLRRLAARPHGGLALEQVWRLWRELIMANSLLQFPFTVDTVAASRDLDLWDMGRAHFCFETPMHAHHDAVSALEQIKTSPARVALLPSADDAWWPGLAEASGGWRIFAALPMIDTARGTTPRAFVVGDVVLVASGDDITVLHLAAQNGIDEAALRATLERMGHAVAYWIAGTGQALVGLSGFLDAAGTAPQSWPDLDAEPGVTATIVGAHAAPVLNGDRGGRS